MTTTSFKDILMQLMIGAVPEREFDIRTLWNTYNPDVTVSDVNRLTLNATKDRISIDVKTVEVFWILGFSGWHAIECYAPHVLLSATRGETIAYLMQMDEGPDNAERDYKERLAAVGSIIEGSDIRACWPSDIPMPTNDRDTLTNNHHKVAFDLTGSAVAFALLHEFRHVMLDKDHQRPGSRQEEELMCDVWAREFMIVKLQAYAQRKGFDYHEVLRRRSMAFALAAMILHQITPVWDRGGNCDYFSVATRMVALLDNTPLAEDDHFWNFAAALLIGICRQQHIQIDPPAMSSRALTSWLLGKL